MRYTQPQSGPIQIDQTNPLAQGLRVVIVGGQEYIIVDGIATPIVKSAGYATTTTEQGIAVVGPTSDPGFTFPYPMATRSTSEMSTVFIGRGNNYIGGPSRYQLLSESLYLGQGIHTAWYSYLTVVFTVLDFTYNNYLIEATVPEGSFVAAHSFRVNDYHTAYVNGGQVGKVATLASSIWYNTDDYSFLGTDSANRFADGLGGLVYDRALSDYELEQITLNPWQVFKDSSIGVARIATITLPTLVRPLSDVSTGAWTSTAGTLSSAVNESIANDSTYITTDSVSTCVMTLDQAAYPGGANQVLTYRASSSNGATITITLKQGATTIASWTHSLTGTITEYAQTLSAPQIATIVAGPINVEITTS